MNIKDNKTAVFTSAHIPFSAKVKRRMIYTAENVSILSVSNTEGDSIPRFEHSHPEYEFCIPGVAMPFLSIDGRVYFGESGWVYPAGSGILHGIKYNIYDAAEDDIVVKKEYFEKFIQIRGLSLPLPFSPFIANAELLNYIAAFKNECCASSDKNIRKLNLLSALICEEIIDCIYSAGREAKYEKTTYQRGIRKAVEYFNEHYAEPVSLAGVAEMCGMSRNYFTACFRRMSGDTPLVYLTRLRISKAKQYLVMTGLSVNEIARRCGYTKPNTFTQAFLHFTGKNPAEFRRDSINNT